MLRHYFALLAVLLLMTACQPGHQHLGNPELPYPPQREPQVGDILHLPTGSYVDKQVLLDQASRNQVVFVGETHDNPASHLLQLEILEALEARNPGKTALAMEMFTPAQQAVLDRWVAGELSEKEFLKEVDWFKNWKMDFALYQPLLEAARARRIPVIALNADKSLQRKVGRTPFAELSDEERAQLPEMVADPYQTAATKAFYSGHKMGDAAADGFQRVQTLWDETMAENLANYLQSAAGKDRQVVVVAGGNHVRYGYGIPRRLFRRIPVSYLIVGSREIEIPESRKQQLMNLTLPQFPMPAYQFLQYTRYEELPEKGVKLGIMIDAAENGILIKGVLPGSVAEEFGLQKGDLLTMLDGDTQLTEPFDLIYALQQKQTGAKIELTVERAAETLLVPIEFTPREPHAHGMKHGKQ
ncbi:MAG TPA: ChaN family lipoprotein [Malonomonas sp.]